MILRRYCHRLRFQNLQTNHLIQKIPYPPKQLLQLPHEQYAQLHLLLLFSCAFLQLQQDQALARPRFLPDAFQPQDVPIRLKQLEQLLILP